MQPTLASYSACSVTNSGKLEITTPSCCSRAVEIKQNKIYTKIANVFVVKAQLEFCAETCDPVNLVLINIITLSQLAVVTAWPCNTTEINYEGELPAGTELGFKLITSCKIKYVKFTGTVDINQHKYDQIVELRNTTAFDKARKVQYIISRPDPGPAPPAPALPPQYPPPNTNVIPWNSNALPWKAGLLPPNAGETFNGTDFYDKYQSVQYSVFFYLGIDMANIPKDSPELTIFIKNFIDRGTDNYLKKVYMFALRCENMPKYANKIDTMLNEAMTAFTVLNKPVISSFKEILIRFFLAMHVGEDNYPSEVIEYFTNFIDVVGFGDPDRVGRDAIMLRGNDLVPFVKQYYTERLPIVEKDDTTLIYYWILAGLPVESLLIESIHNIVAFSQYTNTLYRLIADKLWASPSSGYLATYGLPPLNAGKPIPPSYVPKSPVPIYIPSPSPLPLPGLTPCGPVNFFAKMAAEGSEEEKIDVCREAYRILAPNTNSFSKLMESTAGAPPAQARHIWQQIMIAAQPAPPTGYPGPLPNPPYSPALIGAMQKLYQPSSYFAYGVAKFDNFPATFQCTHAGPKPPLVNFNPEEYFRISETDSTRNATNPLVRNADGSVLDIDAPNLIPVLTKPVYLPFGRGYRGCAGEILNYFFTIKMIEKFKNLEWEVRPFPNEPLTYTTIAPFTAVPDNIYVKK